MKRILVAILMLINLTSCVGYSVMSGVTSTSEKNDRGNKYAINDKPDILKVHGKPARIDFKDGKEFWTYNEDLALRGVMLAVIIPIPLIVPVGYNKAIFEFDNDIRVKTTINHSKVTSAYLCGFLPTGDRIGFGCYSK